MKQIKLIMGMPITLEIVDSWVKDGDFKKIFDYFKYVDQKFSTYKKSSEISYINSKKNKQIKLSEDMQNIFELAEQTKKETDGYFDIFKNGHCDPSGVVKGWAINNAANLLKELGFENFYIEAGGDIQTSGKNSQGKSWIVGIRNPFNSKEIIKVLRIEDQGVATSGTYIRGFHIYNPHGKIEDDIVSLTVVGPNICDADRFATASFAMGRKGIFFLEKLNGFEGYMVSKEGIATYTTGFKNFLFKV